MVEAALWGALAASSLVIGALIGLSGRVPRRIVALVMGFGAGALVSALAFDLTAEAFELGGTAFTAAGLAGGAIAFFLGDLAIRRRRLRRRRRAWRDQSCEEGGQSAGGMAIVLGVLLDGIPESIVLGATLLGGVGASVSFLAAVSLSMTGGAAGARQHRPLWTCPRCGKQYVTRNMWHSCAVVPLDAHFVNRPRARDLFDALRTTPESLGPTTVAVSTTRIEFMTRARFAGAVVRKDSLRVGIWLKRRVDSPRWARVDQYGPRDWGHFLILRDPAQIDDEIMTLLRESCTVGDQQAV